jgi:hypothetical protein
MASPALQLPPGATLLDDGSGSQMKLPPGATLVSGSLPQAGGTGEVVNDVGNRVIIPKQGESFADTMKRAAAYGKTVTPQQINAEMATAPKKVAQTLGAAPLIGAAGAAALAGAGQTAELLQYKAITSPTIAALAGLAPKAAKWIAANPVKAAAAYELARQMGVPLPNFLKMFVKGVTE